MGSSFTKVVAFTIVSKSGFSDPEYPLLRYVLLVAWQRVGNSSEWITSSLPCPSVPGWPSVLVAGGHLNDGGAHCLGLGAHQRMRVAPRGDIAPGPLLTDAVEKGF